MHEHPSISVVIPTFNRAEMVCDCVASVLATRYPALEVIVVDDCSPDDTGAKIAARFGGDFRVRYHRNGVNRQLGGSRNVGASLARGKYLLFIDDDNLVERLSLISSRIPRQGSSRRWRSMPAAGKTGSSGR